MFDKILNRFLKYISFDTQSDDSTNTHPSTEKQKVLGLYLVDELKSLGIDNAYMDEYGYVYAKIKGTKDTKTTVGLIAHMDTALEFPGQVLNPNIINNYQGEDIVLKNGINLNTKDFPQLKNCINHTLVTTDGTTLLGADDKAGIAIIISTLDELLNGNYSYPNLFIAFTPDEEIGEGTEKFNYDYFKADFAYTLDGGPISVINYENFNAASANITFTGKSIHPGSAYGKMVNSQLLAMEFQSMLPNIRPENTNNYDGFNHLSSIEGSVSETKASYIIRNHDKTLFENQIKEFIEITNALNEKYGYNAVETKITYSYQNMKEKVNEKPYVLEYPVEALKSLGYTPTFIPIRGGTDGARLSFNGIVCPNLGTGGDSCHGPYEYVSVNDMENMVKIVIKMLDIIK